MHPYINFPVAKDLRSQTATSDLSYQVTVMNSECKNDYATKYNNAGCCSSKYGISSLVRNVFMRCVPTAACLSHKAQQNTDTFVSQYDVAEAVGEDTLPGVRVQRSSIDQRTNAHIGEYELNQWLEKETGMDRVRMMFSVGHDGTFIQESTRDMNSIFYRSVVLGSLVSVVAAAAADNVRKQEKLPSSDKAALNKTVMDKAALRRIFVQSLKTTFRFTAFSATLLYLSQTIAAYRNKSSVWEYTVASTLSFGLLEVGQGLRRCAKLAFRGSVLGTLGGYVVCQILAGYGMNQEQQHLECVRHYLQEQNRVRQTTESSEGDRNLS